MNLLKYKATDHIQDIIYEDNRILHIMYRFGCQLGFQDKTIEAICQENHIDLETFLAVSNYIHTQNIEPLEVLCQKEIYLSHLITYLQKTHSYYYLYKLPGLRRKLIETLNYTQQTKESFHVLKSFDDFILAVKQMIDLKEQLIYPLLHQNKATIQSEEIQPLMGQYHKNKKHIQDLFHQMINSMIEYHTNNNIFMHDIVSESVRMYKDMAAHEVIDKLITDQIIILIRQKIIYSQTNNKQTIKKESYKKDSLLSQKEKEIAIYVAKGLCNKDIAQKMSLSINTILTHRRNINRKLAIHSTTELIIYTIAQNWIEIENAQLIKQ